MLIIDNCSARMIHNHGSQGVHIILTGDRCEEKRLLLYVLLFSL
jgi:hypothetical protein